MNVFVYNDNPSCEGRGADAFRLTDYFRQNGCNILPAPGAADLIVLFTCAYNQDAEDYYIDLIERFIRRRYKGEIIVAGCLPAIAPERLARVFSGTSLATADLSKIGRWFPGFGIDFEAVADANEWYLSPFRLPPPPEERAERIRNILRKFFHPFQFTAGFSRKCLGYLKNGPGAGSGARADRLPEAVWTQERFSFIRIATGCLGNCSYCGIRSAIGRHKSKPPEICLSEYRRLLDAGQRRFEIGSEDTGAYGLDIGTRLPELLREMSGMDRGLDSRWFLASVKPLWLLEYEPAFLDLAEKKKISHFECPVQSGSQRILGLMNRPVDIQGTIGALAKLRRADPGIRLSTHIIVGFPSETDRDFAKTMDMLAQVNFDAVTINPYSDRPLADTVSMAGKVGAATVEKRTQTAWRYMQEKKISPCRPVTPNPQPLANP